MPWPGAGLASRTELRNTLPNGVSSPEGRSDSGPLTLQPTYILKTLRDSLGVQSGQWLEKTKIPLHWPGPWAPSSPHQVHTRLCSPAVFLAGLNVSESLHQVALLLATGTSPKTVNPTVKDTLSFYDSLPCTSSPVLSSSPVRGIQIHVPLLHRKTHLPPRLRSQGAPTGLPSKPCEPSPSRLGRTGLLCSLTLVRVAGEQVFGTRTSPSWEASWGHCQGARGPQARGSRGDWRCHWGFSYLPPSCPSPQCECMHLSRDAHAGPCPAFPTWRASNSNSGCSDPEKDLSSASHPEVSLPCATSLAVI